MGKPSIAIKRILRAGPSCLDVTYQTTGKRPHEHKVRVRVMGCHAHAAREDLLDALAGAIKGILGGRNE